MYATPGTRGFGRLGFVPANSKWGNNDWRGLVVAGGVRTSSTFLTNARAPCFGTGHCVHEGEGQAGDGALSRARLCVAFEQIFCDELRYGKHGA